MIADILKISHFNLEVSGHEALGSTQVIGKTTKTF
jgi:hypothetical protein